MIPTQDPHFTLRMATADDAGLVLSFMRKLGAYQKMADKIIVEKDVDTRLQESHDLQNYMVELVPQVPLYVPDLVIAYNKNLEGTYLFGGGNHVWSHAYVKLG